jgi:ADP-ribose pyrophosphatase YjhB (NUDIX family)
MNPNRPYRKPDLPADVRRVFEGKIFDVYQWEQELYDGTKATFEKISRPDTAVIFPVLPDGRILIIEDSQPQRETVLTAVSGRVEEGETPEKAVQRELMEETGFEVKSIELFYEVNPVEKIDWRNYVFLGKGCRKTAEPKPDAGEKIITRLVTFDELINLASEGTLRGKDFSILALGALLDKKNMESLRQKFAT